MARIKATTGKEYKEKVMVNERIYIAIAIALTGAVMFALMTVFNIPA